MPLTFLTFYDRRVLSWLKLLNCYDLLLYSPCRVRFFYKALNEKAACIVRFLAFIASFLVLLSSSVASNWTALKMLLGGACS